MTAETGAALEALYRHWKNPPRYLDTAELSNIGLMTDSEYDAFLEMCERINAERKQKWEDELNDLAWAFRTKHGEELLCC